VLVTASTINRQPPSRQQTSDRQTNGLPTGRCRGERHHRARGEQAVAGRGVKRRRAWREGKSRVRGPLDAAGVGEGSSVVAAGLDRHCGGAGAFPVTWQQVQPVVGG